MISHRSRKKAFQGELFNQRGQIKMASGLSDANIPGDLSLMGKWLWSIGSEVDG